ncbi:MAG: hypothetical protein NZV14_07950 [Bryobacteraceae bacterium]|nr:hypothetical protein [Bryobacteraceae bacterium]MDW8378079.1 hypothetical protein [Bryobacterales bacterium]
MAETLVKLRPDRDLQCYFERPSAIAALSEVTESSFVLSGTWRQQFDWAVVEWNRDNVFEHPRFRNLPDGNLSGLTLSYDEVRINCMEIDSTVYPTVDWPMLRIWASGDTGEQLYFVRLKDYAVPIEGQYVCARAEFTLGGELTAGDYVGLAWEDEHYNYQITANDTVESVLDALAATIQALSPTVDAERVGQQIRLTYVGAGFTESNSTVGANGNRVGVYGYVAGARTEFWLPKATRFSGGVSPTKWRVTLNFGSLVDTQGITVPTSDVRKMRWTYAAALQPAHFVRSEFEVRVTNWSVIGNNRAYQVAGPGSYRIEDSSNQIQLSGSWAKAFGNYSGGSIHYTSTPGSGVMAFYRASNSHRLYLGTRRAANCSAISVSVDDTYSTNFSLQLAGEDILVRQFLGEYEAGEHSVAISHVGAAGTYFYFDFLEIAIPSDSVQPVAADDKLTLATDWDTDHSLALAPERTAWQIVSLGFKGRVNHYVGALWFYELIRRGHSYAKGTITFFGTPGFSEITQIIINRVGQPPSSQTVINHLNLLGETAEDIAKAFELVLNSGYTSVWAEASGAQLTIYSRSMGADGNSITISAFPESGHFRAEVSGPTLTGGQDGAWRTDTAASPRLNRAVRDWSRSFYRALKNYGLDVTAAFSMELQHGDPSVEAGIAQRYPSGNAVVLNTPALQTNFSPASLSYWKEVYREMASIMAQADCVPYLQFGEVQWWYFPYDGSGLPFHDAYSRAEFFAAYGFYPRAVPSGEADPAIYAQEASFMAGLIGAFTNAVMTYVRSDFPACRFEVLYPTDVNEGQFNRLVNYPSSWNTSILDNLKTESFIYTGSRDLNKSFSSIQYSEQRGFARGKRSHLIGLSDAIAPWEREVSLAKAEGLESIVLFALDQYCLIGYDEIRLFPSTRSCMNG